MGTFPEGASAYGLLDMAGNVWEWTASLWGEDFETPDFGYPYDPEDGRENPDADAFGIQRVLRGGAFYDGARDVRCACRDRCAQDVGDPFLHGVRVAASLVHR